MTVQELIEQLEQLNPDAEVRFAHQPNYPLWCHIGGLAVTPDGEAFLVEDPNTSGGYASADLWEMAL